MLPTRQNTKGMMYMYKNNMRVIREKKGIRSTTKYNQYSWLIREKSKVDTDL